MCKKSEYLVNYSGQICQLCFAFERTQLCCHFSSRLLLLCPCVKQWLSDLFRFFQVSALFNERMFMRKTRTLAWVHFQLKRVSCVIFSFLIILCTGECVFIKCSSVTEITRCCLPNSVSKAWCSPYVMGNHLRIYRKTYTLVPKQC